MRCIKLEEMEFLQERIGMLWTTSSRSLVHTPSCQSTSAGWKGQVTWEASSHFVRLCQHWRRHQRSLSLENNLMDSALRCWRKP
ncbi:hypothetical protein DUNSADRAFT_14762 [Dunaliella salina]|uniref:Encoded protein n=1 Tax=Dunaliella salina TaxID=3046 RepID=A0ABQ7G6T6_DUNSA|nr:hypothetical protein DUNSADRAFT_14762 [Dunaliella salina]|eukprot:KAF5830308.1 hypothetical protein DUNSADRAFT_14762 [Dunaliella salina]